MVFLIFLLLLVRPALGANYSFPPPAGYVNDFAGVIDPGSSGELSRLIADFEAETSDEVAVVTVPTYAPFGSLEEYASDLFRAWKIGKGKKDNGVLVIVSLKERKVRIEVGYGLEGDLPDGLAGEIIRTRMAPFFREGKYGTGLVQGVKSIIAVLRKKGGPPDRKNIPPEGKSILDHPLFFDGLIILVIFLFILSCILFSPFSSRRGPPGGFWGSGGGGFGGGFGGFGGFGGGSSGGGGATGDW